MCVRVAVWPRGGQASWARVVWFSRVARVWAAARFVAPGPIVAVGVAVCAGGFGAGVAVVVFGLVVAFVPREAGMRLRRPLGARSGRRLDDIPHGLHLSFHVKLGVGVHLVVVIRPGARRGAACVLAVFSGSAAAAGASVPARGVGYVVSVISDIVTATIAGWYDTVSALAGKPLASGGACCPNPFCPVHGIKGSRSRSRIPGPLCPVPVGVAAAALVMLIGIGVPYIRIIQGSA